MLGTFVEQILNGLTAGATYALVAAGLALTVGVLRVVNFAHGDLFMLGSYIFWFLLVQRGLPYPAAAALTVPIMSIVGVLFFYIVIFPVLRRSWQIQLVATLAASTIINNGVIWLVGSIPESTPTVWSLTTLKFLGLSLSEQRMGILAAAPVLFGGLHAFLKYSKTGMAMRAVSQNRDAAEAAGIRITSIGRATFVVGTALVGFGNILITPAYSVYPAMGALLTLKGFAVMVVGGYGRVNATIAAAFLLGVAEALGIGYVGAAYADAFAFIAMILVLLLAPYGLFGRKVGI
jgi:branched-chain amino acid transport system permease protein